MSRAIVNGPAWRVGGGRRRFRQSGGLQPKRGRVVEAEVPAAGAVARADVPAWARTADLLAAWLLLLAIGLAIGGPIRLSLGPLRISIGSMGRVLAAAGLVLLVRHWRHRRPSAVERWRRALVGPWTQPAFRTIAASFWAIRLAVLLTGYLAVAAFGMPGDGRPPFRLSENEFLNLPARWDAGWYLGIAASGYSYRPVEPEIQQNIAFLPAFPVAMRVAGAFLGVEHERLRRRLDGPDRMRLMWAGTLVSLLSAWAASWYLYRLGRQWLDHDRALSAVLLLQAYPFALFYGAAYTEGLFLLACAGALLCYRRASYGPAAAWGLLAGLSRPNGFVVSVPLGLWLLGDVGRAWRSPRGDRRVPRGSAAHRARQAAAAAAPALGTALYSALVLLMTGDPWRWAALHAAWGREYRSLAHLFGGYYERLTAEGVYRYTASAPIDALNLSAAIFALGVLVPVWRRFGPALALFVAATVLPPMTMGGVLSMGRITAVLFPAFYWLAGAAPAAVRPGVLAAFAILQGLAAALFFTWRPLF